jgi:hypothetical protein
MRDSAVVIEHRDGRRVAVKTAADATGAARLYREAELLRVASHPGVVKLVSVGDDGLWPVLCTAPVDGPTLAEVSLPFEELAGVVAAVASTLADLHDVGVVHGAVAPEHVLLEAGGRPVLCGLGYGGTAGEPPVCAPAVPTAFRDPEAAEDAPLHPSVDVFALGALLGSGGARSATGGAGSGRLPAPLRELIASATGERAARPSARDFTDALSAAVPGARLPRPSEVSADDRPDPARVARAGGRPLEALRPASPLPRSPRLRPRRRPRAGAVLGLAMVGVAGVLAGVAVFTRMPGVLPGGRDTGPERAEREQERTERPLVRPAGPTSAATTTAVARPATPGDPGPPATTTEPGPGSATVQPVPTAPASRRPVVGCPQVAAVLAADVDGDGCAEALRLAAGVLEAGDRRWEVGQAGDLAAVGDWACTGRRTLAVLRPATGEVYRFDTWATADAPVVAPLVAKVDDARALRAADLDRDGCHELVVDRFSGPPAVLPSGRAAP